MKVTGSSSPPLRAEAQVQAGWIALGLMALLLASLAAFWPATRGPFVFDDFPNLQNLEQISSTLDWPHVGRYLWAFNGNPGRPLSALSFLIEDSAWPTSPTAFKVDNLLLHLLTGIALFALGRRLARLHPRWSAHADTIALAACAMWLLHPMQLSATMLVVQRMNILATLGMVVGMLGYLRILLHRGPQETDGGRILMALAWVGVATVVSILFKENGALLPLYVLAVNATLLRSTLADLKPMPRRLLQAGLLLPVLVMVAGLAWQHDTVFSGYAIRDFSLVERLLTEPRVLFDYARNILLPQIGGQGLFHDGYVVSRGLWSPPATSIAIFFLPALGVAAWRLRARYPGFAFAIAWFLCGHVMESTVIPLELYFEHRNYLPMFGPLLALAAAVLCVPIRYAVIARIMLAVWLLFAVGLTRYNAGIWGDRGKLSLVWMQEQPQSTRAAQMAAAYYFDQGDIPAAKAVLDAAVARMPHATDLKFQRALVKCYSHGLAPFQWNALEDDAGTTLYLEGVAEVAGAFVKESLAGQCHGTVTPSDAEAFVQRLIGNPAIAAQPDALGYLYYEVAKVPEHTRNLDRLMYYLDQSYKYRPNPLVPREQAIDLLTAGLPDDAIRYLQRSNDTPQPWLKARLLGIRALNAPLMQAARQMQHQAERHSRSVTPRRRAEKTETASPTLARATRVAAATPPRVSFNESVEDLRFVAPGSTF